MHWNVSPDALPGSVRLIRVLDRWLNDCKTFKRTLSMELENPLHESLNIIIDFHQKLKLWLANIKPTTCMIVYCIVCFIATYSSSIHFEYNLSYISTAISSDIIRIIP